MADAETGRSTPIINYVPEKVLSILGLKWRRLEELAQKLINRKWAVIFNRACLNKKLVPKYCLNIYIYI